MGRTAKPPRIWFDECRQTWTILDHGKTVRTGERGWKAAQAQLDEYLRNRGHSPIAVKAAGQGYVYFISADFPEYSIKVGFTKRLEGARLQSLQTSCPYQLVFLGCFSGTYRDENLLHRQFASDRLCGKWFRRSDLLMEIVRQTHAEKAA